MAINNQTMYQFKYGTLENFSKLTTKDEGTLYFLEDTKQIYLGNNLFTGVLETKKPATGVEGKFYYADNALSYWDGSKYVVVAQDATAIDEKIATAIAALKGAPTAEEIADGATQDLQTLYAAEKAIEAEASRADAAEAKLQKDIDKLNGADTVEGSVAKVVKDAKTELVAAIAALKGAPAEGETQDYDTLYEAEKEIERIATIVAKLDGAANVDGSVKKQISDSIAAVVNGAPEAFDTLKEIADWIANDETGAASIITRVAANETAIAVLNGADTVDGSVAKAVKDAKDILDSAIAAEVTRATGAETALAGRLTTIEGDGDGSIKKAVADLKGAPAEGENQVYATLYDAEKAIKANASAIATLNGADTVDGSVAKTVKDAVDNETTRATGAEEALGELIEALDSNAVKSIKVNDVESSFSDGVASVTINGGNIKLDGYTAASAVADVAATDTVNAAIGKLEARLCWQTF